MTALVELRVPPDVLAARVAELGADVAEAYAGTEPVLITVLKGGATFMADLVRHIGLRLEVDMLAVSVYGRGGTVRIVKDLDGDVRDRHVLIVEDIIDTGLTLAYLLHVLAARQPASLRICTLFDRRVRRIAELPLDFVGFEVGDEFLVGYGLDLDGRLRHLRGVVAVTDPSAPLEAVVAAATALVGDPGGPPEGVR